jgi:hypothetical protein
MFNLDPEILAQETADLETLDQSTFNLDQETLDLTIPDPETQDQ